jgi:hypothetical protein
MLLLQLIDLRNFFLIKAALFDCKIRNIAFYLNNVLGLLFLNNFVKQFFLPERGVFTVSFASQDLATGIFIFQYSLKLLRQFGIGPRPFIGRANIDISSELLPF